MSYKNKTTILINKDALHLLKVFRAENDLDSYSEVIKTLYKGYKKGGKYDHQ